jgi:hypothetical protein
VEGLARTVKLFFCERHVTETCSAIEFCNGRDGCARDAPLFLDDANELERRHGGGLVDSPPFELPEHPTVELDDRLFITGCSR